MITREDQTREHLSGRRGACRAEAAVMPCRPLALDVHSFTWSDCVVLQSVLVDRHLPPSTEAAGIINWLVTGPVAPPSSSSLTYTPALWYLFFIHGTQPLPEADLTVSLYSLAPTVTPGSYLNMSGLLTVSLAYSRLRLCPSLLHLVELLAGW